MRKLVVIFSLFSIVACSELQQVINNLPIDQPLTNGQISSGLKEALDKGIMNKVDLLAKKDGFFKNDLVRILLPKELQKVDKTLRDIGLSSLADEGLKVLNRAAEDAVSEGIPIFVNAVKGITINDAKSILFGENNAATEYLKSKTSAELYNKFNPIIKNSFKKVGADRIWESLILKYNTIPFTADVNPDLTDYTTNETLKSVFKMIAVEEVEIREKVSSRTTDLLKRVFALQD